MASVATNRQVDTNPAKPPISTHPLFPAIVALWFASLLGLGSLVLPTALLERAAMATDIATVIPAAAPPFGLTARILIALAFTLTGTVSGLLIARRVARAHAPKPAARFSHDRSEQITRAPINAHEELGHEGFDGQATGRRRNLALKEDEGPSEYLDRAPLPGAQDISWPTPNQRIDAGEPLELSAIAENADEGAPDREMFDPVGFEQEAPARQEFIPSEPDEPEADSVETGGELPPEEAYTQPPSGEFEADSDPEPMEALPFSPPRGKQLENAQAHNDGASDLPDESQLAVEEAGKEMAEKEMTGKRPMDWSETLPEELGLVQLAERLGSALEKHREFAAARIAARPAPQRQVPTGFDVAEPDEAALAKHAYFGGGQATPDSEQEDTRTDETPLAPGESLRKEPAPEAKREHGETERQIFRPAPPAPARKPYQPFAGFTPEQGSSDDDEDEIEELAASFTLPIDRQAARPLFMQAAAENDSVPPAADLPAETVNASQVERDGESPEGAHAPVPQGYGSLLGIKNPFKEGGEKFVRIDEEEFESHDSGGAFEPTVVFPGRAKQPQDDASESEAVGTGPARPFDPPRQPAAQPQKPAAQRTGSNDTDEMLREALLNLQRTSGAA